MRFLANENFPLDAVEALRNVGHEVAWVRADAPGSSDPKVLQRAVTEARVLLTQDKDIPHERWARLIRGFFCCSG
jgi:predicted nuclease of predicted toxin-antitoxin system